MWPTRLELIEGMTDATLLFKRIVDILSFMCIHQNSTIYHEVLNVIFLNKPQW